MNYEDFITYEQAVQLKELGFDWKCRYYYDVKKKVSYFSNIRMCNPNKYEWAVSAPTLAQTRTWIFKKYGLWIELSLVPSLDLSPAYFIWSITDKKSGHICNGSKESGYIHDERGSFKRGIDKVLELIKEKQQ